MEKLIQDLKYGVRSLRRSMGFTAVVIAVMALGIGVNTMGFSMVYAVMWRPLPLPQPERLTSVALYEKSRGIQHDMELSGKIFQELRERQKSFDHVGAWWDHNAFVVIDKDVEQFFGATVTSDLFPALGVQPILGRNFTRDEEPIGRNWSTIIISERIWRERYGSSREVLGKTMRFNGRTRTIVGVMPKGFRWPEIQDFWIPMPFDPAESIDGFSLAVVGRIKPGVTNDQASADVAGIVAQALRSEPKLKEIAGFAVPLREHEAQGIRPMMMLLLGAGVFVLLIACSNVANLMLARGTARRREIAMRVALGATRGRIVRQLLTESLLLSLVGGGIGILLANWGMRTWLKMIPLETPFWMIFSTDGPALAFTAAITILAALAFGLAPALHSFTENVGDGIREGSVQTGTSKSGDRMRSALVIAEVALSLVLLIGAGLMLRSFMHIADLGRTLRTNDALTASLLMPIANYADVPARRVAMRALFQQLPSLPGVVAAAGTTNLPLNRNNWDTRVRAEGTSSTDPLAGTNSNYAAVTPGYFSTIGLPLLRGRDFTARDDENSPRVAIVNEALAAKMWPKKEAIGQRVRIVGEHDSLGALTVVGIAKDLPASIEEPSRVEGVFVPHMQSGEQVLTLILQTRGDAAAVSGPLRELVRSRHPDMPISDIRTMPEYLRFARWMPRFFTSLMIMLSTVALIIAGVGLYGVMAYSVAQRTREIGIRMALGAAQGQVQKMIVGKAMRLTMIGCGIGLAAAYALTRSMAAMLLGVSTTDPPTYVMVALILMASGVLAAWVPAYRASRVDPMVALRQD